MATGGHLVPGNERVVQRSPYQAVTGKIYSLN